MPVYELEVINTKLRSYRLLTIFIVLLQVSYFILSLFNPAKKITALINLVFIIGFVLYRLWIAKKNRTPFYLNEWIFFLLMILWVDELMIAIANLVFFLLYGVSMQKIIFTFSENNIKVKRVPFKTYEWNTLQNVVLKDGILTLDFKNNTLAQHTVEKSDVNENEFNQFARQLLKAG